VFSTSRSTWFLGEPEHRTANEQPSNESGAHRSKSSGIP